MSDSKSPRKDPSKGKTPREKKISDKDKDEKEGDEWEELDPSVIKGRLILNDEQKAKLEEFKAQVKDCTRPYHDDGELTRWLVAREWDLKKAVAMFTESMKWRTKEGIDTILETCPQTNEYFEILNDYWPHSVLSTRRYFTRDGWPVMYEKFGALDLDMVDIMPLSDLIQFHMYTIEKVEEERRKAVEKHGFSMGFTLIQDLEGLGLDHIGPNGVKVFKTIAKIDQDNFPEGLRKVYFVNTPKIFQVGWKLVKSAIDDGVVAKFNFFGGQEEYLPELRKVMTDENIPEEYGGKAHVELKPGGSVKKYKKQAKEIKQNKKDEKEKEKHEKEEKEKTEKD